MIDPLSTILSYRDCRELLTTVSVTDGRDRQTDVNSAWIGSEPGGSCSRVHFKIKEARPDSCVFTDESLMDETLPV